MFINPKLLSQQPTHLTPDGVKVKLLKDYGNGFGCLEYMEGPHQGKWTNSIALVDLKPYTEV